MANEEEKLKANISRLKREILVAEELSDKYQKSLLTATSDNVDRILKDKEKNAIKIGELEMELESDQEKLRDMLGTTREVSLTLPDEVWERINYELQYQPNSNEELIIREVLINYFFPSGFKKQ